MKGIILAGGTGSRLIPSTFYISKQLLPVYNKPMIYYPLSTLFKMGLREILVISTPHHLNLYKELLGDGSSLGVHFEYAVQEKPSGLSDAYRVGEKFIKNDSVTLILGDNIYIGAGTENFLKRNKKVNGAVVFGYQVPDPERYGVLEVDENHNVVSVEEKPAKPKSNICQTGLYITDNDIVSIAKNIKPSARGELEITSAMEIYLKKNKLKVELLGSDYAWFDVGTYDSLLQASNYIQALEMRQGATVGCVEMEAFLHGFITENQVYALAKKLETCQYGKTLKKMLDARK